MRGNSPEVIVVRGFVTVALAAVLAACGGAAARVASAPTPAPKLVGLASDPKLGQILVDGRGQTLYYFVPEQNGNVVCTGDCRTTWLPLTVPAGLQPTSPAPLPGTLGAVDRPDGGRQVTYDGWPLYRYSGDKQPGDTLGEGAGGQWFVAEAAGESTPTPTPPPPPPPPAAAAPPPPPVAAPPPPPPPTPRPVPRPFNDGDRDNMGGPSDGDGNG